LLSTIWSVLPSTVEPSARYHVSDVAFAQAIWLSPLGWSDCCSTSTPPPSTSTSTATIAPGKVASRSTDATDHGASVTGTVMFSERSL
jgi:hypothetical protein